jgi:predicted transcriptional regulator
VVKGMITDRDICMACFTRNATPAGILVQDAMSRTLHSCNPESSIAEAEKTMRKQRVRRMPVVDRSGRLVGVLSLADIAREAGRELDHGSKDIEPGEVLQVLESICQPQPSGQHRTA